MIHLDESNFDAMVKTNPTILIDFYADWCAPCRAMMPTLQKLEAQGHIIGKVDITENEKLTNFYGISAIPALLVFKNGKMVNKHVGVASEAKLKELLK